jgi:ribosomal protein S18 acetylase RimI-like enzyme
VQPNIQIARMPPDMAVEVSRLMAEVITPLAYYNERAKVEELGKYQPDHLVTLATEEPDAVLVAVFGRTPVGFCVSRYDDALVWLSWFGVAAQRRGQGIGDLLLDALERSVPARRAHKLWCDTRTENVASERLLRKRAYRQIVRLSNHWYGQDFYLWEKLLGSGDGS